MLGEKEKSDIFNVPNIVLKQKDGQLIMSKQMIDDLNIKPTETNLKEIIQKNGMVYLRLSQGCWGHCTFDFFCHDKAPLVMQCLAAMISS